VLVDSWLPRAAAANPRGAAVSTPEGEWTYSELLDVARWGAGWLAERGAGPGERVAIALAPGLAFVQALHACLLLGAVAVPVDLRLGESERRLVCEGAAVVVDEPLWEGPSARPAELRERHDLDAVAAIVHTSGTTSVPRPIALTYGNFLWSALGSAVALGLDPAERWLCALPLSHVGGLSILVRSAVYGTTAVVHERFDAERALAALDSESITLVSLVATTLARLLDAGLERPPALRCALTGGGPVPGALAERALAAGIPVSQTYGLTESCSQATTVPVAAIGAGAGGADGVDAGAGPPLFCTQARTAPDGEILLRGPTIASGSRDADGWLHTGDLGDLDERGNLHVTGRKADTIITGGENVAPAEVEAALDAHPAVLEAAVVARPHPQWGEAVTAIVVTRPGQALDAESLRAHCARRLAGHKVPREFVFVAGPLPRTGSGKLLRRELA
jgi:O-succinylbenzoic acid--CoA ligase